MREDIHNLSGNSAPAANTAKSQPEAESSEEFGTVDGPQRVLSAPYRNSELIQHLHSLFVTLRSEAPTYIKSDAPAGELLQRIGTSLGQFFLTHDQLLSQLSEVKYIDVDHGSNEDFLCERLSVLRSNCHDDGSARQQLERQSIYSLLSTISAIATFSLPQFRAIPTTYSSEAREYFGVGPLQLLSIQINQGLEQTLLHTGSIGKNDAVLGSPDDFTREESALRILSTLSKLSQMRHESGITIGAHYEQRRFCSQFGILPATPEESVQELRQDLHQRYLNLQPHAIALLHDIVVERTRHLMINTELYRQNNEFARRVDSEDPIELINSNPVNFPHWHRLRSHVVTKNDFTGAYSHNLQLSLSRCFVEWGVETKGRQCDDFAHVINIVRADWPNVVNRAAS